MSDSLRRIFNRVDAIFDRQALTAEISLNQPLTTGNDPLTARPAFELALAQARRLDKQAALKMIVAPQGVDAAGTATRWEFFFDLPRRRATLTCDWMLVWDAISDTFGPPQLEVKARPFPPPNSPLHQLVRQGKLLHRQLNGLWRQERQRHPNLPHHFRNSDSALAALLEQGLRLDEEFTLTTSHTAPDRLHWLAQTRTTSYRVSFT